MNLKALLLCDDVRQEVGGTLTLVGVANERIFVEPGRVRDDGMIELPRLAVVVVITGLRGAEQVAFRMRTRRAADSLPDAPPLAFEPHARDADEHNFVVVQSPFVLPGYGMYEVLFEVDANGSYEGFRYRFSVEPNERLG